METFFPLSQEHKGDLLNLWDDAHVDFYFQTCNLAPFSKLFFPPFPSSDRLSCYISQKEKKKKQAEVCTLPSRRYIMLVFAVSELGQERDFTRIKCSGWRGGLKWICFVCRGFQAPWCPRVATHFQAIQCGAGVGGGGQGSVPEDVEHRWPWVEGSQPLLSLPFSSPFSWGQSYKWR